MSTFPKTAAILVAAGRSTRMGGQSKQLLSLEGIPVVVRSAMALMKSSVISQLIVVCQPEEQTEIKKAMEKHLPLVSAVYVSGGNSRQQSVQNGVTAAHPETQLYAIHDGARPLVDPRDVEAVIRLAMRTGAATLGVPVKDTIKVVDTLGTILSTPDRSQLYAIHTPQVFDASLYKKAVAHAEGEGKSYTDDCQLVEQLGHPVSVCQGSDENLKITTDSDMILARALLVHRKDE